jgi:Tfp pilus assembly protein PilO
MGSKREKLILLSVLAVSAIVALSAGVWIYFLSRWGGEFRTANDALRTRVSVANAKLAKLNALRAEREQAQARLDVAESILPSQEEIENLVDNLSEFAKKSGVTIVKTAPVRQTAYKVVKGAVKRFEEADFDIELVGDFFQFVEFLNYLENYKRFIRVDDFAVAAGRSEGEPNAMKLKFATFTYVEPVAPAAQKAVAGKGATK